MRRLRWLTWTDITVVGLLALFGASSGRPIPTIAALATAAGVGWWLATERRNEARRVRVAERLREVSSRG